MHGGNGLKYKKLLYPDHIQNWLDYGYGLVIFLILVLFWLSETGKILGLQAFSEKPTEEMARNFACWCILATFRTDKIMVTVCRFFWFKCYFDLVKWVKFGVSRPCWSCFVDFPHYGDPLAEIGHIWGFWALSVESVEVNVEGRAEAYFRRFESSAV